MHQKNEILTKEILVNAGFTENNNESLLEAARQYGYNDTCILQYDIGPINNDDYYTAPHYRITANYKLFNNSDNLWTVHIDNDHFESMANIELTYIWQFNMLMEICNIDFKL